MLETTEQDLILGSHEGVQREAEDALLDVGGLSKEVEVGVGLDQVVEELGDSNGNALTVVVDLLSRCLVSKQVESDLLDALRLLERLQHVDVLYILQIVSPCNDEVASHQRASLHEAAQEGVFVEIVHDHEELLSQLFELLSHFFSKAFEVVGLRLEEGSGFIGDDT